MKVIALCHTPPEKFFKWSDKNWKRYKKMLIASNKSTEFVGEKLVVFLTYDHFTRFARRLDDNAIAIVFCPYHQILPYSHLVNFIDVKPDSFNCVPKKRLYIPKALIDFRFDRMADFVTLFADHIEQNSMLTYLMTFIYTLDSKTQQKPVNYLISNWMKTEDDIKVLERSCKKLDTPMTSKQFANLQAILEMPVSERVRAAMQLVGDDPERVDVAAKEMNVEPYEVRYLLIKSDYSEGKIIDEDIKVV